MALSGGVPGADETRNPGIGDPSWIKEPWSVTPPPHTHLPPYVLAFGSTVRSWITYYDL
jgi:hypothetical protein